MRKKLFAVFTAVALLAGCSGGLPIEPVEDNGMYPDLALRMMNYNSIKNVAIKCYVATRPNGTFFELHVYPNGTATYSCPNFGTPVVEDFTLHYWTVSGDAVMSCNAKNGLYYLVWWDNPDEVTDELWGKGCLEFN